MAENEVDTTSPAATHTDQEVEMGLNFSCMLFLFTEMMALFNELTKTLVEKEVLTQAEVQKIFEVTADKEELRLVYNAVTHRFVQYYGTTKQNLRNAQSGAPAENSATEENPEEPSSGGPQE